MAKEKRSNMGEGRESGEGNLGHGSLLGEASGPPRSRLGQGLPDITDMGSKPFLWFWCMSIQSYEILRLNLIGCREI